MEDNTDQTALGVGGVTFKAQPGISVSTPTVDYAQLAAQSGAIASTPPPQAQSSQTPVAISGGIDYSALAAQSGAINHFEGSGQTTNGTGAVITPKDDESFDETMKRAAAFGQSAQAKSQAAQESTAKNLGTNAAQTLVAAPIIGAAGAAGGAAVNEVAVAVPSVIPHTIEGVKALGPWAQANPVQAYILYQVIRDLVPGAKKAMGLIKGMPEESTHGLRSKTTRDAQEIRA